LQHGRDEVKFAVLQTLSLIADDEAETAVRQFYYQTEDPQLQKLALLALADMGASMPNKVPVTPKGKSTDIDLQDEESVEGGIQQFLFATGQEEAGQWCLKAWQEHKNFAESHVQVRKAVAWVAALEYVYGTVANQKKSQAMLAEKYGISAATIAKCVKVLSRLDFK
jgi:hypothetical protein